MSSNPQSEQSEPVAKRQKIGWGSLPLKEKIKIFDQLKIDAAVAKQTKGQDVKGVVIASGVPSATFYRWKGGLAEAIRAAMNDVPSIGDLLEIGNFDLTKYAPRDNDEEAVPLSRPQQEEEAKNNATLVLKALKDHVAPNSIVMDGTNGEGVFLSDPRTKKLYSCILVDKFKNQVQNAAKYKGILSFTCEGFQKYTTRRDVVMVFIWDPPYRTICGGHTIVNCVFVKSDSRIKFNDTYGVQFRYTNAMINAFYLRGFERADQVLHVNGFFFVKCMNYNDNLDQLQAVKDMADLFNFCVKQVYTLKSTSLKRDDSFLLVMVRKRRTVAIAGKKSQTKPMQSLRDVTFSAVEANEYRQDMKRRINAKAAEAYVAAIETSLKNGLLWHDAITKMQASLTEQQQCNAFEGIDKDIIDNFRSFHKKDAEIRQQMASRNDNTHLCWESLQPLALSSQGIFLDLKNLSGLLFEQHLLQRKVCIEDPESLPTKMVLESQLLGNGRKITLVNENSHTALSNNIRIMRQQGDERSQNDTEQQMDEDEDETVPQAQVQDDGDRKKCKQVNITNFFQPK